MNRRRALKQLAALSATGLFINAAQAQEKAPKPLPNPQPTEQPEKIEVLEFFSYGCPHCAHLEPLIGPWAKKLPADTYFVRIPVSFGRAQWASLGRLYYTLEALGQLDRLHAEAFSAIHEKSIRLDEEAQQADWAAAHGIDKAKFIETSKSFSVQSKIQRAEQITRNYRVSGVPMIVINGKYEADGNDFPDRLKDADRLIALARKEKGR